MKRGGGERGDGSGHPKSEITKIKMQQLGDFFNCEATSTYYTGPAVVFLVVRPKSAEIVDPGHYCCHIKASGSFATLFVLPGKR